MQLFSLCRNKKIWILLFIAVPTIYAQSDGLNHSKYWWYRWRLQKSFVVVGDCDGCSIPANQRHHKNYEVDPNILGTLRFGDGTIILGMYISTLATELYMLNQYSQNTTQTKKELYYALLAFNRLDIKLEDCMNMTCEEAQQPLNGYFTRDDVPSDFLEQHPELKPSNQTSPLSVTVPWNEYVPDAGNGSQCLEGSHDQAISILMGLRLITQLLSEYECYYNENGERMYFQDGEYSFVREAKRMTYRIIGWMKQHLWMIMRPCSWDLADGGAGGSGEIEWAYALDLIGQKITGDNMTFATVPGEYCVWAGTVDAAVLAVGCHTWNSSALTYQLIALGGEVYPEGCLLTYNTGRNILANQSSGGEAGECVFEWMPLLHSVLDGYDLTNNLWPQTYADYLNSAPCTGPYSYMMGDVNMDPELQSVYPYPMNVATYNWSSSNLFYSPQRRWDNGDHYPDDVFSGEYNGLDYMLLHNLYCIKAQQQEFHLNSSYYNVIDRITPFDFPYIANNIPFLPDMTFGDHDNPLEIQGFNSVISNHSIGPDGDISFRAGVEIHLEPGFQAQQGSDFHAYISPFNCDYGTNYYRNADIDDPEEVHMFNHLSPATSYVSNTKTVDDVTTQNDQSTSNYQLSVFPNPNDGNFSVSILSPVSLPSTLYISDTFGKIVYNQPVAVEKGESVVLVKKAELPAGIYFVQLDGFNEAIKMIILK